MGTLWTLAVLQDGEVLPSHLGTQASVLMPKLAGNFSLVGDATELSTGAWERRAGQLSKERLYRQWIPRVSGCMNCLA